MGYNRTVCMLPVTSVDICLNSHPGVNGAMGPRSLGDVWFLWYMWQCLWDGGCKDKKANRTGWTKSGMIKINGPNWIHFVMAPRPSGSQQSHETLGMHHTELVS